MTSCREESLAYVGKLFDDVRAMSQDGPGVTRQGFGPVETAVLERLTEEGVRLGLEIRKDDAGGVWMTLPAATARFPPSSRGATPTASRRAGTSMGLPASSPRLKPPAASSTTASSWSATSRS